MRLIDENALAKMIATVDAHHAANVQPEKMAATVHARWIPKYPNKRTGKAYMHTCSECGRSVYNSRQVSIDEMGYAFCPHCGAKMDGDNENG